MARKSPAEQSFIAMVSSVQFHPTPEQRDCKSAFWLALEENPIVDMSRITLAGVMQLTGQPRVEKWWAVPGFKEWFTNKEEFRVRMESATYQALDVLMEIMHNPDANPASRVNAAKLVIEASGKNQSRAQSSESVSDKKIQAMSEKQLEAYIKSKTRLITESKSEEGEED